MTDDIDARPGLRAARELGPFFAVDDAPDRPSWRPLRELTERPGPLREQVRLAAELLTARAGLAPDALPTRVVASTVFLGLAARLIAPALGATLLTDAVPDLRAEHLWWRPAEAGPLPLATDGAPARPVTGATEAARLTQAAALLVGRCLRDPVEPLVDAFRVQFRLSPKVLWGNVASALVGAARQFGTHRPADAHRAALLAGRLLSCPPLAGTGDLVRTADEAWSFRRRSCCLYYRIPGGGLCGDCVLAAAR